MGEPRMRIRVYRESSESDVYMDDVRQIDILDHEYVVYHGAFFTEFRPVAEPRDVLEDVREHKVPVTEGMTKDEREAWYGGVGWPE